MAIRPAKVPKPPRSNHDGRRMSLEEYLALPEEKPYLEYVDGRVSQKVSPRRKHWTLAVALSHYLFDYSRAAGGRAGVEPHVMFVAAGNPQYLVQDVAYWAPGKPQGDDLVSLPPTLAIEIRSPEQTMRQLRDKCRFYRANDVDACWLIDPEGREVEVFHDEHDGRRVPSGGVLTSSSLPGFSLRLSDLFALLDD